MNEMDLHDLIDRYEAVSFTVTRRLNAIIAEHLHDDLTIDQFSIMRCIDKRGTITSTELSEAFFVGKSAITAIITRLEDKKIISRTRDAKDRRVVYLSLTEEGSRIFQSTSARIDQVLGYYIGHFESAEIDAFIRTYEKFARIIQEDWKGNGESR